VLEVESPNEETPLLPRRLNNSVEEFMAMYVDCCPFSCGAEARPDIINRELHLQIKLLELQDLLKQTQHEPRLKGPFPMKLYRSILASLQTILDKLHSMRCVTTREEWYVILWPLKHQLHLTWPEQVHGKIECLGGDMWRVVDSGVFFCVERAS
jgi:hypothetical protein